MRLFFFAIIIVLMVQPTRAEDVFYCNITDAIMTAFYTVPNDPIYTQKVEPRFESFKLKRAKNGIVIKDNRGEYKMNYLKNEGSYFLARGGMQTFQFNNGKTIWNGWGYIYSADCDKF